MTAPNAEYLRGPWTAYIAEPDGFVYTDMADLRENCEAIDDPDAIFEVVIVRGSAMPKPAGCRDRLPGSYTTADKAFEADDLYLDSDVTGEVDESESVTAIFARAQAMAAGLNAAVTE
jgi:hypothetical protein